jgi:glycosyltransferase involved in cell wall biosynthesis
MSALTYSQEAIPGLISIVIPAYRADDFIGEALRTIARQTYTNWELILVEDASQGKTEGIVRQFAGEHPTRRVTYLRNEKNGGAGFSRNVAFREARGEFVALLDADDRWLDTHLAASMKAMQETNADLVYSTVVMIEDQSELLLGLWGPDQEELNDFPHGLFTRNFITPSATVLRRSVLADVGLWKVNCICEDLDFWLRCLAEGKRFAYVGGCHCLYRQNRPDSVTKNRCAMQESVARIIEQYIGSVPGTRVKTCRNRASRTYARAARYHYVGNSRQDPSRDLRRIPTLLVKAWTLRPKRVDYLLRAAWQRLVNSLSLPSPQPTRMTVSQNGHIAQAAS